MRKYFDDYVIEAYLDDEEKFYDYKTSMISGDEVVDSTKTGMSYYDDFLDVSKQQYLQDKRNLVGMIVKMTPEEYYTRCARDIFQCSVESLKSQRRADTEVIKHLTTILVKYRRKLCMPMINYADQGQEGLHRMFVIGELYGWNYPVPVLVVDWYDKNRAIKELAEKEKAKIDKYIEKAIEETLEYSYENKIQVADQLLWELSKVFEYEDEYKIPENIELKETADAYLFTLFGYEYPIDKERLKFHNSEDNADVDDIEWDLLDPDDWVNDTVDINRTSKDESTNSTRLTFKLVESIEDETILDTKEISDKVKKKFGKPYPGPGCIFIAPDGTFINIYPELDDHEDLCYWLEDSGIDAELIEEDAEWFVSELNYVRCRDSLHLCFCQCPSHMTSAQYCSLETWLEEKVSSNSIEIIIDDTSRIYNTDDYFPEDIVKRIKRYYSSGTLYESGI